MPPLICQRCSYITPDKCRGLGFRWIRYLDCDIQWSLWYHVCSTCHGEVQRWYEARPSNAPLKHADISSVAHRADIPPDIQQLLIICKGGAYFHGQPFSGELLVNTVALNDNIHGAIVFMVKVSDQRAMSQSAADHSVARITELAHLLPDVERSKNKAAILGWMKCLFERFSRNSGDFGRTEAECSSDRVAECASELLQAQVNALGIAFPQQIIQALRRYAEKEKFEVVAQQSINDSSCILCTFADHTQLYKHKQDSCSNVATIAYCKYAKRFMHARSALCLQSSALRGYRACAQRSVGPIQSHVYHRGKLCISLSPGQE